MLQKISISSLSLMIRCRGCFYLMLALLPLVVPLQWFLAAIIAAAVHELFHYFMIIGTGNSVYSLELTCRGTIMHTSSMTCIQELFCALAGPAGSILLFCCYPWIPRIALCAGIQGAFNLLPIGTLDGGRILSCLLQMYFNKDTASMIKRIIEAAVLLSVAGGIICIAEMHNSACYLLLLLLPRFLLEKFLAKKGI